jgi:hypothetical protein
MMPVYASNVLMKDSNTFFVLPSAMNDSAGVYTITASDVLTGAVSETKITLK